jgi:hypothetical protein
MDIVYILQHWHLPSIDQVEISITLGVITLFALWPIRFFMHKVETMNQRQSRERYRIVCLHAKERHKAALRVCMEGECSTLTPQKGSRVQGLAATLAAEVAQSVHH